MTRVHTNKSRALRRLPKGYVVYLERIIKILGEKLHTDLEKQHLVADILDNLAHNFGLTPKQVYKSFIFYNSQNRLKNVVKEHLNERVYSEEKDHVRGVYKFTTPVFPAAYDVNSDDPGPLVDTVVNNIINQINQVKEAAADYKLGMLQLDPNEDVFIRAGASNSWGGKSMPYNMTNNYKSTSSPVGEFDLDINSKQYADNLNLAKRRAEKFYDILVVKLKEKRINISKAKLDTKAFIVDTGGKTDKNRPSDKKRPGQHIFVNIRFRRDKFDYTKQKINKDQVLTGAYFCNLMNSRGQKQFDKGVAQGCGTWKDQRLSAFEIKYKENVIGNTDVVPIARWYLNWNKEGMIDSFTLVRFNPFNKEEGHIISTVKESVGSTTCKKYMTMLEPTRWNVAVEPFFTKPWTMPNDVEKAAYGKVFDK